MKELSVGEQRYKAVMAVLSGGRTVTEVARDGDVSRQTLHAWLARYERNGMEGMGDRSHRPTHCPHQMPALIEVRVLEMRRSKAFWSPRRLALGVGQERCDPDPIPVRTSRIGSAEVAYAASMATSDLDQRPTSELIGIAVAGLWRAGRGSRAT